MRPRKSVIFGRRLIALWAAFLIAILAVGFVGTAYPFFLMAGLAFSFAVVNTSERRWRSVLSLLVGREVGSSEAQGRWRPANSILLVGYGLIWLVFGVVALLFANVRLVKLLL
jgi:hypothetical protein